MGFVTELRADSRDNPRVDYETREDPSLELIEDVIRRMDQRRHTEVTLSGRDWWFMQIGGGTDRYVVSIENQMSGIRYQLIDSARPDSAGVEVVTGGQLGRFPSRLITNLDNTLKAASHFADTGEPDAQLSWVEEQGV
jgi:hypothetical protein